jgi:hypothetical protein
MIWELSMGEFSRCFSNWNALRSNFSLLPSEVDAQ